MRDQNATPISPSTAMTVAIVFSVAWFAIVFALWFAGARGANATQIVAMTAMAYLAAWAPFFAASQHSRRDRAKRFVAVNASLLLTLALLELVVPFGWVDYRQVLGKRMSPWEDTRNRLDPELLHIRRPYSHEQGEMAGDLTVFYNVPPAAERPYDVKYDQHGFRNDVDYEQAACVVIGDSFVESAGVSFDELFTTRMANTLEIPVVNLGQSYYGPQQELEVLKRFALPLKPDVCVWVFFEGNDLQDVWRYQEFVEQWPASVANYSSWKERSLTMNLGDWLATRLNRVPPSERKDIMGTVSTGEGAEKMWFGYVGKPLTVQDVEGLKLTLNTLVEAHALCEEQGVELVVVFAPTKYRVYADVCHFREGTPIRHWVTNPLPRLIAESLPKISPDIGYLDLTTDLQEAAKSGEIVYYPDDTHWSPQGHQVVGRAIANYLAEHAERLRNDNRQ